MANSVKDKNYNMISSIYHLAQGSENCKQYASDAQRDNDDEAAKFFEELQRFYSEHGDKAARILKERL
ncbi:hypothetical protein [Modicisalibacter radicis]|uniref:hypothetical protein n=1 Tax=Halomonas sp. EAR18 TaxID=2518972 RepID=UPI00109C90CE|nr:hypothetical protein [Halomonas sp. EAR18]